LHCTATACSLFSLCVIIFIDHNNRLRRHRRTKSSNRMSWLSFIFGLSLHTMPCVSALGLRSIVYSRSSSKAAVQAAEFWCTEQQQQITMSYEYQGQKEKERKGNIGKESKRYLGCVCGQCLAIDTYFHISHALQVVFRLSVFDYRLCVLSVSCCYSFEFVVMHN
jgi:hypothetical protein